MLPVSYEEVPVAAVQGWLGRYPQGVEFVRAKPGTVFPGPVCVRPKEPDRVLLSPFGRETWAEYYKPTPAMMKEAMADLAGMKRLSGNKFRDAVDSFERRFGPLARNGRYLAEPQHMHPMAPIVEYIRLGSKYVDTLPLWCYKREARILDETLVMYRAIYEGNIAALPDWRTAWYELLSRIHPYLYFVGFGTDTFSHKQELIATSTESLIAYVPKQELQAANLLGAIYIHVLQVVLGQQLVRSCVADGCNRTFVPSRSDKFYCSSSCASSERSRRHRAKQRTAKG